jgi:hypothetical protein
VKAHHSRTLALPGSVFGRLTVLAEAPKRGSERCVLVRCACNVEKTVRVGNLANGNTRSCGCLVSRYRGASPRHWKPLATVTAEAVSAQRKRLPIARSTCEGGCSHDGQMMPGGSADGRERDSKCAEYAACSLAFVKAHKAADRSHCPKHCQRRHYVTPPEKATAGWAALPWPGVR